MKLRRLLLGKLVSPSRPKLTQTKLWSCNRKP